MFVTAFASTHGGVGKTAIAANLAGILTSRELPVVVIEWDPGNLLGFHLGMPERPNDGWIQAAITGEPWHDFAFENSDHVQFLPFGAVEDLQRIQFEHTLATDESWLARRLRELDVPSDTMVLLDVLRGPSVYLNQALAAATLVLTVLNPTPAFALDIAAMEALAQAARQRSAHDTALFYVLNQIDTTRRLSRDILVILRTDLDERLLRYVIHRDEALPEAIASNTNLAAYAPDSQAAHDLQGLASWLSAYAANRPTGPSA